MIVFNNKSPDDSMFGITTGRDPSGAHDGSLCYKDIENIKKIIGKDEIQIWWNEIERNDKQVIYDVQFTPTGKNGFEEPTCWALSVSIHSYHMKVNT